MGLTLFKISFIISFLLSIIPFTNIILVWINLDSTSDDPMSPLTAAIATFLLAFSIILYTTFSATCRSSISVFAKFINPTPCNAPVITTCFQNVLPIISLLQLVSITWFVNGLYLFILSIIIFLWLLNISLSSSISNPKYFIFFTTSISSILVISSSLLYINILLFSLLTSNPNFLLASIIIFRFSLTSF